MRYYKADIVLTEVPDEISLCFSICGCTLRCEGCHSPFLWKESVGNILDRETYLQKINTYDGMITCILFMGGEWHEELLAEYLMLARERGLKTCLYTGLEDVPARIKTQLTYLKTGPWIEESGGLNNPFTNQRFIETETGKKLNHLFYKGTYDTINT